MNAKKTCNGISSINLGYYVRGLTVRVNDSNEGCDGGYDECDECGINWPLCIRISLATNR